jgi:hypothetical protein
MTTDMIPTHDPESEIIESVFDDNYFWLRAAESSFEFWDNDSDAIFDDL